MVDAFATSDDLATLLNRSFTAGEAAWVDSLLASASTYLRSICGYDVWPQTTSTVTLYPDFGRVELPQIPIVSIDTVQRGGEDLRYGYRPGYLTVRGDEPVDVTFTWGFADVPPRLKDLACVIVSTALVTLENGVGLSAGGLSSLALDDFKVAWADAGAGSGLTLPPIQEAQVRAQFGRGDVTVVSTR